ncbi:cell division protein FtsA, partial [Campylobacter coli LMG 23336]
NRQIRQEIIPQKEVENETKSDFFGENLQENDTIIIQEQLDFKEPKEKKPSVFSNIWHKIMNQF